MMTACRLAALLCVLAAGTAAAEPRHGLSAFGELKYPAGFRHFDYVEPAAPKGGEIRTWELDSFDNLNPLILKGTVAAGLHLVYETLLEPARDEPDALYGLVAETVELCPGRACAAFNLNPKARWHDGTPITADDVVFTFNAALKDGHPQYRLIFQDVESVAAEGPRRVTFRFKPTESRRDLPLLVAQLPILSQRWFRGRDFGRPVIDPPPASGPYRIDRIDHNRSIAYRRVPDYWGKDLPVNVGRHNFEIVRYEYFRDRDIATEAFFGGAYDFRIDVTAKVWATGYDRPPVNKGFIKREVLPDGTPSGVQGFFLNSRRPHLADRRVRAALNYAFDYEWQNKNLFYGLYQRTRSMFENSDLAATGKPGPDELKLLEPFRGRVPDEVFTTEFQSPVTDGTGNNRANMRVAQKLLADAGWTVKDGRLVNAKGDPFVIEFLLFEPSFTRIVHPFARNLERLGIKVDIRIVDLPSFENRMRTFDFDVIGRRFSQPLTPGVEQRVYWGSAAAAVVGSFNYSGIKDPAVDALVERIISAGSRAELNSATRALDRVLMWGYYTVPHWYSGTFKVAYWDKFGRPPAQPKYATAATLFETWWVDPARERRLPERQQGASQ